MILGVDPGASGGFAWFHGDLLACQAMPDTERDIMNLIRVLREKMVPNSVAYVEKLGHMPRDKEGKAKQSGTTMFKMGFNYGALRMAIMAADLPIEELPPLTWQRHFRLLRTNPNESSSDKKNRHKARAQQLFPMAKVTLATCDAILIAEYGRRERAGLLGKFEPSLL